MYLNDDGKEIIKGVAITINQLENGFQLMDDLLPIGKAVVDAVVDFDDGYNSIKSAWEAGDEGRQEIEDCFKETLKLSEHPKIEAWAEYGVETINHIAKGFTLANTDFSVEPIALAK